MEIGNEIGRLKDLIESLPKCFQKFCAEKPHESGCNFRITPPFTEQSERRRTPSFLGGKRNTP